MILSKLEAKELLVQLAAVSKDDKVQWYKKEKVKRVEEKKTSKRNFSQPKSYVDQKDISGKYQDGVDSYALFDDYAMRMTALRRADSEANAAVL